MSKPHIILHILKRSFGLLGSGTLVAQIGHTGFGMMVFQVMAFLSGVIIARWLGPEGQGKFSLVISITVVGVGLLKFGLDEGLAYLLPHYRTHEPNKLFALIGYTLFFSLIVSALAGIALAGFADALEKHLLHLPGIATDLQFSLLLFPSMMLMLMGMAALRGLSRSDLRAYIYYYGVGGSFILLLFAAVWWGNGAGLYIVRITSFVLGGLACLFYIFHLLPSKNWGLSWDDIYKLHRFSGLLIFVSFFQYLIEQPLIDLIIVGRIASAEIVGIYAVATRLSILVSVVLSMMVVVMAAPFAKSAAEDNKDDIIRQYLVANKWMAQFSLLFAGIIFIMRDPLLGLFGSAYQAGETFLVIFLVGHTLVGFMGLNTPVLLAYRQTKIEFLLTGCTALVMVVAGLLFGIWLGPVGVAIATAGAIVILAIARRVVVIKLLQINHFKFNWYVTWTGLGSFALASGLQSLLPSGWWAIMPTFLFVFFFGAGVMVAEKGGLTNWLKSLEKGQELKVLYDE